VNRFDLTARIAEISDIRYSPAGQPVVDVKLEHESTIEESGIPRKVHLSLKSVVIGKTAEHVAKQAVGSSWSFTGFLASAKNSKSMVFHIQSIQTDS